MRVVSTVKFGWSAGDVAQRSLANFAAGHPALWVLARFAWWFVTHPFVSIGLAVSVWLLISGLWWPLAVVAGFVPAFAWAVRAYLRLLAFPSRGKLITSLSNIHPPSKATLRNAWTRIRRLRKLRKHWPTAAYNAGITAKSDHLQYPKLLKVSATNTGLSAEVACGSVGVTADRVAKAADVIAAGIEGCREVTVVHGMTPGDATLHFQWADPLGEVIGMERLQLPPSGYLTFGITESGEPATIAKFKSLLVVGQSGSGKSGTLWALLASAIADGVPFRLRVLDPAGGVELHNLKESPLVRDYADRPKAADEVIDRAHRAMSDRLGRMSNTGARMHKPTDEEPWEIIVIDELLLLDKILKSNSNNNLRDILSVGRKAAFTVWALTQVPQIDAVGGLRRLFVQKLVLATENRAMTDAVLGDGAEGMGAKCSQIRESTPGIGYAHLEHVSGYQRFRTVWVPDDLTEVIADGYLPPTVPAREGMMRDEHSERLENQPHVLYQWHAPEYPVHEYPAWNPGELLYIGISNNGARRTMEHLSDKEWTNCPGVQMSIRENFSTRSAALEAEKHAIETEHPRYNIVHNDKAA